MGGLRRSLTILLFISLVILIGFATFTFGKDSDKQNPVIADCSSIRKDHVVEIKHSQITPKRINAKICDRLNIVNMDKKLRLIAFGQHDDHIFYSGVEEKPLSEGQRLSVVLSQEGTYVFHDHLEEDVSAEFSVR